MNNMKSHNRKNVFNKKNKRGIIDVQFNWIFIAVAGSIIFIFIIAIVFSQKTNAEKQTNIQISNQLTTLLKGKQQTSDVYSELNFPNTNINFRCEITGNNPDFEGYFTFRMADSERILLPTEIIFAPKDINTNKLVIWTQSFNLGFPVNIFSYVSTSDFIILIVDDSTQTSPKYVIDLNTSIPSNITHKIISSSDVNNYERYKNKKIICFNGHCPSNIDKYLDITPTTSNLFEYGTVEFNQKISPTTTSLPYISKAGLMGAIFSDDATYYSCQMIRAFNHYEIKRDLTERRLAMLSNFTVSNDCKIKLNNTIDNNIKVNRNKKFPMSSNEIEALYKSTLRLDINNVDLTLSNCPKIY
jgi:hypothetical protein